MLQFQTLTATNPNFADCLRIRIAVFVEEQNVPLAEEQDALDATAIHFLAFDQTQPIATARIILQDAGATAKIGRVAVLRSARGQGIGAALMAAIETAPELGAVRKFTLNAQIQAEKFYQSLSYIRAGGIFMENNIPHIRMTKTRP